MVHGYIPQTSAWISQPPPRDGDTGCGSQRHMVNMGVSKWCSINDVWNLYKINDRLDVKFWLILSVIYREISKLTIISYTIK